MKQFQFNQTQIDKIAEAVNIVDPDDVPEDMRKGAQLEDPNKPGMTFAIPLWVRLAVPAVKTALGFVGVEIAVPTIPQIIERVNASNLPQYLKGFVMSALLYIQEHPNVLPIFV